MKKHDIAPRVLPEVDRSEVEIACHLPGVRRRISLVIRLKPTHDIAAELGKMKRNDQRLIGFALETNDELQNAQGKLERKNFDFIVLNSLRHEGTCFQSDENQISIISRQGQKDYERKPKSEVATDIILELTRIM